MIMTCSGRYKVAAMMIMLRTRKTIESIAGERSVGVTINSTGAQLGPEGGVHVLNTNFSVGVSMYSENVTSYW